MRFRTPLPAVKYFLCATSALGFFSLRQLRFVGGIDQALLLSGMLEDVTKVSPDDRPVLRGQIVCLQEQLREPEVVIFASKFCIFLTPQDQSLLE